MIATGNDFNHTQPNNYGTSKKPIPLLGLRIRSRSRRILASQGPHTVNRKQVFYEQIKLDSIAGPDDLLHDDLSAGRTVILLYGIGDMLFTLKSQKDGRSDIQPWLSHDGSWSGFWFWILPFVGRDCLPPKLR